VENYAVTKAGVSQYSSDLTTFQASNCSPVLETAPPPPVVSTGFVGRNVRDFGAVGDGNADDTAAIQSALNGNPSTVYFPRGQYRITRPIALAAGPDWTQIDCIGDRGTKVFGNFDGYLVDSPVWNGDIPSHVTFEKIDMVNGSSSRNAGCVRISGALGSGVENCYLEAWRPITFNRVMDAAVRYCMFRSAGGAFETAGITEKASIAIFCDTNNGVIEDCDIQGYYDGIRVKQGISIRDSRVEMCYRGIVVGVNQDGNDYPGGGRHRGHGMEANTFHIILNYAPFGTIIGGCGMLGDPFSPLSDRPGQAGILINNVGQLVMESVSVDGQFQDAAIKLSAPPVPPPGRTILMAVRAELDVDPAYHAAYPTATAWKGMEFLNRNQITFIQCNNP